MKEFLRRITIFSGLNDEELEFLAAVALIREFPKDTYIIRKNDPGISLFIVRSGVVDVVLDQPKGASIPLTTIKSEGFFGEVSLFDGKPRSATVIAREPTTIVEITRDILLTQINKYPDIALKILGKMSERLRRSDELVKQFSDRIYGDVSQRIEDKLTVQLDSVKTLYEATEDRATKTLNDVEDSWKRLWRLISIVVGVFTVFASAIAYLGYGKYDEIKKVSELAEIAKTNIAKVEKYALEADILNDVMLDIGKIRDETKIDLLDIPQYKPTGVLLKYIAVNFSLGKEELFNNYINMCDDDQPEVCLAAVNTCLELQEKGDIELNEEDRDKILDALIVIIMKSPEKDWRMQLRARDDIIKLAEKIKKYNKRDYYEIIRQLTSLLKSKRLENHAKFNFALILAHLNEIDDDAKMILQSFYKNSSSIWRKNMAAIGLLQMNDMKMWNNISEIIYQGDRESFVSALLLGELGKERLSILEVKKLKNNSEKESIDLIKKVILDGEKKFYANKFMKEYCDYITTKKLQ
ncbi:MAG: cyclic nucleotide-binding domain-containing protein [Desulfobacterales bacterium]|jgi:CRP-like cAMP-binding protein